MKEKRCCGNCKYFGFIPSPCKEIPKGACYYFNFHPMPDAVKSSSLVINSTDGEHCITYESRDSVEA